MASAVDGTKRMPFIEHVRELQVRLTVVCVVILAGAGVAYAYNQQLFALVQKPLGQTLYYTSPTGGFTSLFKLCIAGGIVIATPVILYNIFRFLQPLLTTTKKISIIKYTIAALGLAYAGIAFAYLISLPAALHFLSSIGGQNNVQSIITIDAYYTFALSYLLSFAFVFQLPLLVLFLNRIKPLSPGGMMGAQRYIILASFIAAALLTPTPDPVNQLLMAAPAIVLYQVSIGLVWWMNRKTNPKTQQSSQTNNNVPQAQQLVESPVRQPVAYQSALGQYLGLSQAFQSPKGLTSHYIGKQLVPRGILALSKCAQVSRLAITSSLHRQRAFGNVMDIKQPQKVYYTKTVGSGNSAPKRLTKAATPYRQFERPLIRTERRLIMDVYAV